MNSFQVHFVKAAGRSCGKINILCGSHGNTFNILCFSCLNRAFGEFTRSEIRIQMKKKRSLIVDEYIFICKNLVQPVKSLFAHTELPLGPVTESLTNTRASTNTTRPTVGAANRLVRGREEEKKRRKVSAEESSGWFVQFGTAGGHSLRSDGPLPHTNLPTSASA